MKFVHFVAVLLLAATCIVVFAQPSTQQVHLDVHLVAGTHDDVGWLLTPEQYYEQQVRYILDTSVAAVMAKPSRKFIYVEMYFFQKWWTDPRTTEQSRQNLRTLVARGQWEFVMGGWVMPDEATTTYSAVLDQLTEGHLFLNRTFGITPSTGWQIDPFGASNALATHYRMSGFKHHIIDRINYKVHDRLVAEKAMEFIWHPSASRPNEAIFTHILDENYCQPMGSGFDFESDPFKNPPVTDQNIAQRAKDYVVEIRKREKFWKTPHMLMLHQCDFKFQNAHVQFDNMDKIIDYIQANQKEFNINIRWTTLSEYFKTIDRLPVSTWPKRGAEDFFSYDDNPYSWWTGYFTSRPQLKGLVRQAEAELRTADILSTLIAVTNKSEVGGLPPGLDLLHQAEGIAQHHDAVSGTEKDAVVIDYAELIWQGRAHSNKLIERWLSMTANKMAPYNFNIFTNNSDPLKNLRPSDSMVILVFNPLLYSRNEIVRLPCWNPALHVSHHGSHTLNTTIVVNNDPNDLLVSPYSLYVQVNDIPPAGWTTFMITNILKAENVRVATPEPITRPTAISNKYFRATFTPKGLSGIQMPGGRELQVNHDMLAYESFPGPTQPSGAYIFRPTGPATTVTDPGAYPSIVAGSIVTEVYMQYNSWARQTFRFYPDHPYVDVSNWIGPIPPNREIISRWKTNLKTPKGDIYTDDNGYALHHRQWIQDEELPIPANYYPHIYSSYLQEHNGTHFAIVSDRSHGVSSQADGELEIMLHRRTMQDDWKGLEEAMDDKSTVNPLQRLIITPSPATGPTLRYRSTYELNYPVGIYYAPVGMYAKYFNLRYSAMPALDHALHVMSMRLIDSNSRRVLVRITNPFHISDAGARTVHFDARQLLPGKLCFIRETSATGMHMIGNNPVVQIPPKDIRTFLYNACD